MMGYLNEDRPLSWYEFLYAKVQTMMKHLWHSNKYLMRNKAWKW